MMAGMQLRRREYRGWWSGIVCIGMLVATAGIAQRPAVSTATPTATLSATTPADASAVTPCTDFYLFVNGAWIAQTVLPVAPPDTVRTLAVRRDTMRVDNFTVVESGVRQILVKILTDARTAALAGTKDPITRVLGLFYNSCLVTPPADSAPGAKERDGGVARCVAATDDALGTALGRAYVRTVVAPATVARVDTLAERLRSAMRGRIVALTWMSPATKRAALAKLSRMRFRIGNPDADEEYERLTLSPTDFEANRRSAEYVEYQHQLKEFGAAPDQTGANTAWLYRQYTVNAQYIVTANILEIPAVLFQPPLFDPAHDDVGNYAGLGHIIAHEITHAFDTNGAPFDSVGRLNNWWAAGDTIPFQREVQKLVAQYDAYVAIDSQHVSGSLTVNENIADLGGLNVAFDAYMHTLGKTPRERRDGETPAQRFFKAFARTWRAKGSPLFVQQQAAEDVHAPPRWRVNGVLANVPAFARAFGCRAGDAMVLPEGRRASVW